MSIVIRRAQEHDAEGVNKVANAVSKAVIEQAGDTVNLSDNGFLLYPLAANCVKQPNYAERTASNHFWVATQNERVVAFMMAYTFRKLREFTQRTSNDESLMQYYTGDEAVRFPGRNVFIAQVATDPSQKRSKLMTKIMDEAFRAGNVRGLNAAIAEIAQAPLRNGASTAAFMRNNFVMTHLRSKDAEGEPRVSGTFVRSFDTKQWLPGQNVLEND